MIFKKYLSPVLIILLIFSSILGPGCNVSDADNEYYCVIPLSDPENDWEKIPLVNELLARNSCWSGVFGKF